MATLYRKNPCPGGHESYNFGRPFLGHHHYIYSLSDLCGSKEEDFYPKNYFPLGSGAVMKFTISCLLTLQMLHT